MTRKDFFVERLYDNTQSHEAYFEKFLKYTRSWKYITKKYHPNAGKDWLFWHWCDFMISRIIYPGLDAMDYISYEFHNFSHEKRKTFVTEGFLKEMVRRFNRDEDARADCAMIGNKAACNRFFSQFVGRRWLDAEDMTPEALDAFCDGLEEIMVKPHGKSGGSGIYKARVATREERRNVYDEVHGEKVVLEEIIVQHPELAEMNPNSVNTYRIYTCNDGKGKVNVAAGAFRVGGGEDFVDNYHRGGYAAAVDVDTGIVTSHAICFNGAAVLIHPYTGAQITGRKLPEWSAAVEMVKQAHKLLPRVGYIAWDVAVSVDHKVMLVEANVSGGVDVQQQPSLTGVKPLYMKLLRERERAKGT